MRILHTSDWHLGAEMEGRKRSEETKALLDYIIDTVDKQQIDTLLVTGDVFDTHSPSNMATKQYYDFLVALHKTKVQNVVIIAGNHDSPSYLEAPAELLKLLHINVIGSIQNDNLEREVIPLKEDGRITAVACAVPYLISPGLSGRNQEEQDAAYENYVVDHYKQVVDLARELYPDVPVIALGHFFAVGGKVSDNNALRGNLHSVHIEALPLNDIDYLALGHLHNAQVVNGVDKVRYPGSLQKMSFIECDNQKEFVVWDTTKPTEFCSVPVTRSEVPEICRMAVHEGSVEELETWLQNKLQEEQNNSNETTPLWVAVQNTGIFCSELKNRLENLLGEDSKLDIVICRNKSLNPAIITLNDHAKKIRDMTPEKMFDTFLTDSNLDSAENGLPQDELEWYRLQLRELHSACEEADVNKD